MGQIRGVPRRPRSKQDRSVRPKARDAGGLRTEQVDDPLGDEPGERAFVDVGGDTRRGDLAQRLLEPGPEPQSRLGFRVGERGRDDRGEALHQGDRLRWCDGRREQRAEAATDLAAEKHRDGDARGAAEPLGELVVRAAERSIIFDDDGSRGANRSATAERSSTSGFDALAAFPPAPRRTSRSPRTDVRPAPGEPSRSATRSAASLPRACWSIPPEALAVATSRSPSSSRARNLTCSCACAVASGAATSFAKRSRSCSSSLLNPAVRLVVTVIDPQVRPSICTGALIPQVRAWAATNAAPAAVGGPYCSTRASRRVRTACAAEVRSPHLSRGGEEGGPA